MSLFGTGGFGGGGGVSLPPVIGIDTGLLASLSAARAALVRAQAGGGEAAPSINPNANRVLTPWDPRAQDTSRESARLRTALADTPFVDEGRATLDGNATAEQRRMFALYRALDRLQIIADEAARAETPAGRRPGLDQRFQRGMAEFDAFLSDARFTGITLLRGKKTERAEAALIAPSPLSQRTGAVVARGDVTAPLAGVTGTERFTIQVTKAGITTDVAVDLADLSGPPTLDTIAALVNQRLEAEGMVTRMRRVEVGESEAGQPRSFALRLEGVPTERIAFSAETASQALYMGLTSGSGAAGTAGLRKLVAGSDDVTSTVRASLPEGTGSIAGRVAVDGNGHVYMLGTAQGDLDGQAVLGTRDVFLRKYDSTGALLWSRLVGASAEADGLALALAPDGSAVIAGRVTGRLTAGGVGGGTDAFVAKYAPDGSETFLRQIAPVADDGATALAVSADGRIHVGGFAKSAIGAGLTHGGGSDATIQVLEADGSLVTRSQFGGAGDERVAAMAIAADGGLLVASIEDGQAFVAKFDSADLAAGPVWRHGAGPLNGTIAGLAVSGSTVYLAGATANGTFGNAAATGAHQGGLDGFVLRLSDLGAGVSADATAFVGTASTERVGGIAVAADGTVFLSGDTTGTFPGEVPNSASPRDGFIARFGADLTPGRVDQFGGLGGLAAGGIAIDERAVSALDRLGLPRGRVDYVPSRDIQSLSSVRPGDWFTVAVDGGRDRRITIEAGETLDTLARKIERVLLLRGEAEVRGTADGRALRITAAEGRTVELKPGTGDFDALRGLGIEPGRLIGRDPDAADEAEDDETRRETVFGLGLSSGLNLTDAADAAFAKERLLDAMTRLRRAYREMTRDPALDFLLQRRQPQGPVPAQLQAQLANYQAGLARLQAGGGTLGGLF